MLDKASPQHHALEQLMDITAATILMRSRVEDRVNHGPGSQESSADELGSLMFSETSVRHNFTGEAIVACLNCLTDELHQIRRALCHELGIAADTPGYSTSDVNTRAMRIAAELSIAACSGRTDELAAQLTAIRDQLQPASWITLVRNITAAFPGLRDQEGTPIGGLVLEAGSSVGQARDWAVSSGYSDILAGLPGGTEYRGHLADAADVLARASHQPSGRKATPEERAFALNRIRREAQSHGQRGRFAAVGHAADEVVTAFNEFVDTARDLADTVSALRVAVSPAKPETKKQRGIFWTVAAVATAATVTVAKRRARRGRASERPGR